jgi:hypothetical protein
VVDGWKIKCIKQPAQLPDLNVLDLCFFASLQARAAAIKMHAYNLDQLIAKVREAWDNYIAWMELGSIYSTCTKFCIFTILANNGGNQYTAPHRAVGRVAENVDTSVVLTVDVDVYNAAFAHAAALP